MSVPTRSSAAASLMVLALIASQSLAQGFPGRPIRALLIEASAGSVTDIVFRAGSPDLASALGQPLVIENRAGGNGVAAMEACARSTPDGHTICVVATGTMSFNPNTFISLPYNPERDFKPVAHMYFLIEAMYARASLPVNSIKDLQALAAAKPGALTFATSGIGTNPDMFRQWLGALWKTEIIGVPYKGGSGQINAIVAGEVDFGKFGLGNAAGHLKSGKVKFLAVTSETRLRVLPDVPTMKEIGLDGYAVKGWWGIVVPAGTPDAIVNRVNAEFVRLFRQPKFAEFLENQFLEVVIDTPESAARFMKANREYIGELVRKYNVPRR